MANEKLIKVDVEEIIERKSAEMCKNVESVQKELGKVEAEGAVDKDLVKIILTGQHEIKGLFISPNLLKESNKVVEAAILAAYESAKFKVEEGVKKKMIEISKGLGIFEEPTNN